KATVFRDGRKTEIPASKIVPGDVAVIKEQGNLRPSPITGKIDEDFYRAFYGRFDERNKR
ncbi:MAG: hypothetical protein IKW66_06515, partial [Clostridia bacterium]|nr:hypothetical protein [Clostridia bacterium]